MLKCSFCSLKHFFSAIFALQIAFFGLNEKLSPEDILYSSDLYNEFGGESLFRLPLYLVYRIKELLSA